MEVLEVKNLYCLISSHCRSTCMPCSVPLCSLLRCTSGVPSNRLLQQSIWDSTKAWTNISVVSMSESLLILAMFLRVRCELLTISIYMFYVLQFIIQLKAQISHLCNTFNVICSNFKGCIWCIKICQLLSCTKHWWILSFHYST